MTLTK